MKTNNYPLTLNLGILVFIILMMIITCKPKEVIDEPISNNPQLIMLDSIAEYYESQGWTSDAAYIIAGFEIDLYDESDTAEYKLYKAYMED